MFGPKFKIYIIISLLFISGFVNFFVEFAGLGINVSYVSALLDMILVMVAMFSFGIKGNKMLIAFMLLFLMVSILSYFINIKDLTLVSFVNGMRDFLPYFLFPVIFIRIFQHNDYKSLVKIMNRFLYIFLIVQIPVSIQQFIKMGAGDYVGGTFGLGGSGVLTFTVYLSTYYLMIQNFDHNKFFQSILKKSYLLVLWLPSFINETKISFMLMILFFVLLLPLNIKSIFNSILIGLVLIPVLLYFDSVYTKTTGYGFLDEIFQKEYVTRYLLGDSDMDLSQTGDIPRFTKIILAFQIQKKEIFLFGNGAGQFKGGTTLSLTPFATSYMWLLQGSRPMLFLVFVQLGLLGFIFYALSWLKLVSNAWKNKTFMYSRNLCIYLMAAYIIIMFYNESLRYLFFSGIFMYFIVFANYWRYEKETAGS